jgi:hypothetical protein
VNTEQMQSSPMRRAQPPPLVGGESAARLLAVAARLLAVAVCRLVVATCRLVGWGRVGG